MREYTLALRRNTLAVDIPEGWPTARGELLLEVRSSTWEDAKRIMDTIWWPESGYSCHVTIVDDTENPYAARISAAAWS